MATPSGVPSLRLLGHIIWSAGCFLFSLLSMFIVLNVSVASRFGCVAILVLYLSALLLIASLTVGISRSLRMSSFLTYQGAFTIVLRILACIISILFIWLIAAVPHSGIPYVQIGFMIVLYIFNLFSMLNLDFRLVSQCICLLVFCIFSIIDLVCSFHVSCVSKWSPRYLTCFVCVICVVSRKVLDIQFLSYYLFYFKLVIQILMRQTTMVVQYGTNSNNLILTWLLTELRNANNSTLNNATRRR